MTEVDDFLEHYGVKGMRWGVRRSPAQLSRARGSNSESSSKSKRPTWQSPPSKSKGVMDKPVKLSRKEAKKAKKLKDLSPDALEFNRIKEQAKKKGVSSLTNQELQKVTQRMELQQKYSKAFPKKKNPLVDIFIEGALSEFGERSINSAVGARNPDTAVKVAVALESVRQIKKAKSAASKKK